MKARSQFRQEAGCSSFKKLLILLPGTALTDLIILSSGQRPRWLLVLLVLVDVADAVRLDYPHGLDQAALR